MTGDDRRYPGNLFRLDVSGQQGDYVAGTVSSFRPGLVLLDRNRGKSNLKIQRVQAKQQITDNRRGFRAVRNLDENPPRQIIVNNRLANVENPDIVPAHDASNFRGKTRLVPTKYVN